LGTFAIPAASFLRYFIRYVSLVNADGRGETIHLIGCEWKRSLASPEDDRIRGTIPLSGGRVSRMLRDRDFVGCRSGGGDFSSPLRPVLELEDCKRSGILYPTAYV
jgi:hypothetical protein